MALKRTDGFTENRYYFDDETNKFYISATSFCSAVLPENKYLTKWKAELGTKEANYKANIAALYGTLMHQIVEDFLGTETYTMKRLEQTAEQFTIEHNVQDYLYNWVKELKNDILAFAQFAYEKELDPIHMERWVKKDINDYGGIAGTVDLECNLKFGRGKVHAIVDLKSGRKGFFDAHRLQLALYKEVLKDETEDDLLIFNWAPTAWKAEPKYKFENQTHSDMAKKLPFYLEIAIIDDMFTPKLRKLWFDHICVGQPPVFQLETIENFMVKKASEE